MKNIFLYYCALFAPALVLVFFWKDMLPNLALLLLFVYVFIYRTILDGIRLASKQVISKTEIWKMILPGMRGKYFKELYLQR